MSKITEHITLSLNSTGYKGEDIDQARPGVLETERDILTGVSWAPSVMGVYSFTLVIVITGSIVAAVSQGFFGELGKDLYGWTKNKLVSLFKSKETAEGMVTIKFEDITISAMVNGDEDLVHLWEQSLDWANRVIERRKKTDTEIDLEYDFEKQIWTIDQYRSDK
ncbi:MAG TPA: hypothetical protein PLN69_05530 [bacterium]|nr:hypothetical protein [bacterium]